MAGKMHNFAQLNDCSCMWPSALAHAQDTWVKVRKNIYKVTLQLGLSFGNINGRPYIVRTAFSLWAISNWYKITWLSFIMAEVVQPYNVVDNVAAGVSTMPGESALVLYFSFRADCFIEQRRTF